MKITSSAVQWKIPKIVLLTKGVGAGNSELTAFDKALLRAGIGNLNLIKVSSIIPPGGKVVKVEDCILDLPKGALIPAVYTQIISATKGLTISSAIGVGIPKELEQNGMILEASIQGPREKAETLVRQMIVEAFEAREMELTETVIISSEAQSAHHIVCTVAAALLL